MVSIDTYRLFKEHITGPLKSKMAEIRHLGSWRQHAKTRFSQRATVSIDDLSEVVPGLFKEPIIGSLKSKMAEIRHLENGHDVISFCRGWSDLEKILETVAEWHVDCGDVVEIETRCRISIWRTFGRIKWHVIPEPRITLQGAATWWIHCHNSSATCHIAGARIPSAILKIVLRHILFFLLMQFKLRRAAAFLSSPINLLRYDTIVCI